MRRRTVLSLIATAALAPAAGAVAAAGRPSAPHSFRLRHDDPRFGGFSAIHLAPNGRDCLLLNDRGTFVALALQRDPDDRIIGADVLSFTNLKGPRGQRLAPYLRDSEGLAISPEGGLYIGFEGIGGGRIWHFATKDATPDILPRASDFGSLALNGGLESLVMDGAGRLWTLPEEAKGDSFPLYRFDAAGWTIAGRLPRTGRFLPVALDFGPDGSAFLLERAFRFPFGFASRLSRLQPGPEMEREILWESRIGQFDNLEGLAISLAAGGILRATMVSDDNFLPVQRSELVEILFPTT